MMAKKRAWDERYRYYKEYPEYTKGSIDRVLSSRRYLDAITIDFMLRPKRYGGKGLGKLKRLV